MGEGKYRPDFDADGFGPGIYLVSITDGGYHLWRVEESGLMNGGLEHVLQDESLALIEFVDEEYSREPEV